MAGENVGIIDGNIFAFLSHQNILLIEEIGNSVIFCFLPNLQLEGIIGFVKLILQDLYLVILKGDDISFIDVPPILPNLNESTKFRLGISDIEIILIFNDFSMLPRNGIVKHDYIIGIMTTYLTWIV